METVGSPVRCVLGTLVIPDVLRAWATCWAQCLDLVMYCLVTLPTRPTRGVLVLPRCTDSDAEVRRRKEFGQGPLASQRGVQGPLPFPVLPPTWKWTCERRFYFQILPAKLLS